MKKAIGLLLFVSMVICTACAPKVTITEPQDGATFDEGSTIVFTCEATDRKDGELSGESVVWYADSEDTILGTGTEIETDAISPGEHTIMVRATNSAGRVGSDEITITIGGGGPSTTTTTVIIPGNGNIVQGVIRDAATQKPLPGVMVSVQNTDLQAVTDSAGNYSIQNIPSGQQSVIAMGTGYTAQTQQVTITAGATASQDFSLTLKTPPFVEVPDPLAGDNPVYHLFTAAVPATGQAVYDPQFGSAQVRVVQTEGMRHEYSRLDPFNTDQSMILLMYLATGEWRVYRTQTIPYDQESNLVTTIDMEEPRWDPDDPEVIWGHQEFRIMTVNVKTGEAKIIKNFAQDKTIGPILTANPDIYRITDKDEGESSADKRYWVFLLQGTKDDYRVRYMFTWDRNEDSVLGLYKIPSQESRIDWIGMSPKGTWVLIGGGYDNGGKLAGLTMANRELTQFHRLDYNTVHADVALDSDNNEIIVMQNTQTDYIDLIPIDVNTSPILESGGSYNNTNRIPLLRLFYNDESPYGFKSEVHISCNVPGYCIVSTFTEPNLPEQNWLDRTITLVKLDRKNPQVFYLAKVFGTRGAYWEETQATITNDGMKIIWATDWNTKVGQERVWCMQLNMPPGWQDLLDENQ